MSDAAILPFERAEPSATLPRPIFPLAVRGLALSYGATQVLAGVDLDLGARGCTVVMGPNGAGKSLLLKLLHGLIAPSGGVIDWAGQSPAEVTRRQALVFQRPVLLRRSVGANIDFVLKARGLPRATVRERRAALLAHVGLAEKTDLPARRLSGGEAQRLALARALATEPEVLFLDEPTASLDPASALAIEEIVTRARDLGTRVIFVTHDVGQARRLADDVVFLHRGRVVEHRPAEAFFAAPRSEAAAGYLAGRIVV